MAAKKDPYKFTIQFNPADPTHLQTAALLNRQGRRKAQFLVNAVMHYIHCSQTPDIPQEPPLDTKLIETVVRQILKEQQIMPPAPEPEQQSAPILPPADNDLHYAEGAETLGEDGLAAIANTMAMFRRD